MVLIPGALGEDEMAKQTEMTRDAALSILESQGMRWQRVGRGQRFVAHIATGRDTVRALVKVASLGSAIMTTDSDDPDKAKLSGFGPDVDHVLFAVRDPSTSEVAAYLVPKDEAERAYRETHRAWRKRHPKSPPNTTWVLWFTEGRDPDCNRFHQKWAQYRVGSRPSAGDASEGVPQRLTAPALAEEKARLAARLGVPANRIRIVIEL